LAQVLGEQAPRTVKEEIVLDDEIPEFPERTAQPAPMATAEATMDTASTSDEEDTMSYFARLANED
jgi:hypothetical protein